MRQLAGLFVTALLGLGIHQTATSQAVFQEDFAGDAGTVLTSAGWSQSGSSATNPLTISSPGLTYSGYCSSGVGNAVSLSTSGQDVYASFTPLTSGTVYLSCMVNLASAQTGDYFIALSPSTLQTNYYARLHARSSGSGYQIGVNKSNEVTGGGIYGSTVFSFNSTYLVVTKYTFNPSADSNDAISVYVFTDPELPSIEPVAPEIGPYVCDLKRDASDLGYVTLRQGSATAASSLTIDGIRVATGWGDAPLPITLASFKGTAFSGQGVKLDWSTISEINNYGFEVQRSAKGDAGFHAVSGLISGHGTTNVEQRYSFTDAAAGAGTWFYRLKQIDLDKTEHFGEAIKVENGPAQAALTEFTLDQNCPNPFNPVTTIQYALPKESRVSLKIYSVLGQEVATLVDEVQSASHYRMVWDGKDRNGSQVSTGMYFYRMEADPVENGGPPFVMVRTMLLEK